MSVSSMSFDMVSGAPVSRLVSDPVELPFESVISTIKMTILILTSEQTRSLFLSLCCLTYTQSVLSSHLPAEFETSGDQGR